MTLRNLLKRVLPRRVKDRMYRWAVDGQVYDASTRIDIGTFGGFQVAFRPGTADEAVIRHSFENDIFLPAIPEYELSDDHTIIDVGAHIGTFSLLCASRVGDGRVHAIEASRDTFNLLRINAALNRLGNIVPHHLALSDTEGEGTLFHDHQNWGHSTVKRMSSSGERVTARRLTSFLEEQRIGECHLLKLNCEGGEFPILLGAPAETLRRCRLILVLYHCDLWPHATEADLQSHLDSAGFACRILNREEHRGWIVASRTESAAPTTRDSGEGPDVAASDGT
jgi:FkbM family methyltransferase